MKISKDVYSMEEMKNIVKNIDDDTAVNISIVTDKNKSGRLESYYNFFAHLADDNR